MNPRDTGTFVTTHVPLTKHSPLPSAVRPHRLGIVSNPRSGRNRRDQSFLDRVLTAHPHVRLGTAETPETIEQTLRSFADHGVTLIAVDGGDGTVQAVLTALFHQPLFDTMPLLAIIPSGTSNMIAGDVGLPGSRERSLRRLAEWVAGAPAGSPPTIATRHVFRAHRVPDERPIYGTFFGAGAIYQGAQIGWRTKQSVGRLGEVGASLIIARFLLSIVTGRLNEIRPIHPTVQRDDCPPTQGELLTLFVTTLDRLFLGLKPYWGTEPKPLRYTSVATHHRRFLRVMSALLSGRPHRYGTPEHGYCSHNADQLVLDLHEPFTIDGESYTPDPSRGPVSITDGGVAHFLKL